MKVKVIGADKIVEHRIGLELEVISGDPSKETGIVWVKPWSSDQTETRVPMYAKNLQVIA